MKANPKTEAAVMNAINQLKEAFNRRDLDSVPLLFAPDPDTVIYGTGVDEKGLGLAGIKTDWERAFSQSEASSIELGWSSVSAAGSVAWVAADCTMRARVRGQDISLPIRLTIVFEQRKGRWLVVQSHVSVPSAGQKKGESWPT